MTDQVVLVDENDVAVGLMPKLEAHQKGVLHRAFSVFLLNTNGEMLLQRRAFGKYHSEGLWTNTCCSHPYPDEPAHEAAARRLKEEMGLDADLQFLYTFQYHAELDKGLIEHELDHVFWGVSDNEPKINPEEVSEFKYAKIAKIEADLAENPKHYTAWFRICFKDVIDHIELARR